MQNKQVLVSIYQNCSTGVQSINDLIKKTEDKSFKDILNAQYDRYASFNQKVETMAEEKGIELKDNNWFEKARMWTSVQMSTLTDNSTRHLAELMLVGTVMGTLTCYKTKADNKKASEDVLALLKELEEMQENNYNELKKYLKDDNK